MGYSSQPEKQNDEPNFHACQPTLSRSGVNADQNKNDRGTSRSQWSTDTVDYGYVLV